MLKANGLLVLTTPNSKVTARFAKHPCHRKEFSPPELKKLLQPYFGEISLWGALPRQNVAKRKFKQNVLGLGGKWLDPLPKPQNQKIKWFIRANILLDRTLLLPDALNDNQLSKEIDVFRLNDSEQQVTMPEILYALAEC